MPTRPRPRRASKAPPASKWRSTPQALRGMPKRQYTLTVETIALLERTAAEEGVTLSELVERAIVEAYGPAERGASAVQRKKTGD